MREIWHSGLPQSPITPDPANTCALVAKTNVELARRPILARNGPLTQQFVDLLVPACRTRLPGNRHSAITD
jgi:hypothetical protein